jgi:hypothetical protein
MHYRVSWIKALSRSFSSVLFLHEYVMGECDDEKFPDNFHLFAKPIGMKSIVLAFFSVNIFHVRRMGSAAYENIISIINGRSIYEADLW